MVESSILAQMNAMSPGQFKRVCESIVTGLGFTHTEEFSLSEIPVVFLETLERRSKDRMFLTQESWLLAFMRSDSNAIAKGLETVLQGTQLKGIQNVLVVVFDNVALEEVTRYHNDAKRVGLRSGFLSGKFSASLAQDYAPTEFEQVEHYPFSFAQLRERMKQQSLQAPWRQQFLSLAALPIHASKVSRKETRKQAGKLAMNEDILNEADLFGAIYRSSSFLLLGDPGAGKTTCLQELAEELASKGGRTPVFLPLNRYEGNLLKTLGEALCGKPDLLSEQEVEALLSTGVLTVILDGLNEVQSQTLQPDLVKDINTWTNPEYPTARSHWITSSRRYDYTYAPQLSYLDRHTWELLPLTSNLIYEFLVQQLGEDEGKKAYYALGSNMREVCSNPLLLNMLLSVRQKSGKLITNRGALYHQFVQLLLRRGEELPNYRNKLADLSRYTGSKRNLSIDEYISLAQLVLENLAKGMQEKGITAINANEVLEILRRIPDIQRSQSPEQTARELYQSLLTCGILKFTGKIAFLHHTFQEYFYAMTLNNTPLEELIPSSGIQGPKREAIVFMASILDTSDKVQSLIARILSIGHARLAYEVLQSASVKLSSDIYLQVARALWVETIQVVYIGEKQREAQMLIMIAENLNCSIEQLMLDILYLDDEKDILVQLLRLYREVGDITAQQQLVNNVDLQGNIPEDLLFSLAFVAYHEKNYQQSVELFTQYMEQHPDSAAYGSRGNAYKASGDKQKAEVDYKRAIDLNPDDAVSRNNYATLLIEDNRKEQAQEQLEVAVKSGQSYWYAHLQLGKLLVEKDLPHEAIAHLEKAAELAFKAEDQTMCIQQLLVVQEQLGYIGAAMVSLNHLIELNPTSRRVREWKDKFANLRLTYEQAHRDKVESGEASLKLLARDVLHTAGWQVDLVGLNWLRAVRDRLEQYSLLPILLLDVPQITHALVQERLIELSNEEKEIKHVVMMTSADVIDPEARIYLAKYSIPVAFITATELREALMRGERACHELMSGALDRANERDNPFEYSHLIKESSEFFGRSQLKEEFVSLLLRHKLVGLYGIHKIGKSSFLRQVRQYLAAYAQHITPVWIEMTASYKQPSDLYQRILRELSDEEWSAIHSTEQFEKELYRFQEKKLHSFAGHQILLILDEYPYLFPGKSGKRGMTDYLEVLGLFKVFYQEGWFNLLPCGRTTALSRTHSWPEGDNPFIGMFQERFLGPLQQKEVEELVSVLGFRAAKNFSDEAIEKIWEIAGGHPFFTRKIGSVILDTILDRYFYESTVSDSMVEEAVEVLLTPGPALALLRNIYQEELEDEEVHIVEKLAVAGRPLPLAAFIEDNAPRERRDQIRTAVENLVATSVLKRDEQKCYSHRYELLRLAIKQDITD